jgi:hypothetical protein
LERSIPKVRHQNIFALVNNALDVRLGSPCKSAIRISEEVTTKIVGYLPNSLAPVASTSEFLEEKVRTGHNTCQVINIDTSKFIMCARIFHPNKRICLARIVTHIHKIISKEIVPSGSTSPKSIESLDNDMSKQPWRSPNSGPAMMKSFSLVKGGCMAGP